jgi:uncharacterized protein
MDKPTDPIVKALLKESEEFRREKDAHQRYEKILEGLARRPHLTPDEEMERKKIQKLKLAGKDRMERMIQARKRSMRDAEGGDTA